MGPHSTVMTVNGGGGTRFYICVGCHTHAKVQGAQEKNSDCGGTTTSTTAAAGEDNGDNDVDDDFIDENTITATTKLNTIIITAAATGGDIYDDGVTEVTLSLVIETSIGNCNRRLSTYSTSVIVAAGS